MLRSLRGLADAVEPGGHLIYTNQPWHPQVEFIARVLTNREGQPWIMRRRTQAEMDELVRTAGFEKVSQEIDPWGIFTVSVARRVGPDAAGGRDRRCCCRCSSWSSTAARTGSPPSAVGRGDVVFRVGAGASRSCR